MMAITTIIVDPPDDLKAIIYTDTTIPQPHRNDVSPANQYLPR